MSHNKVNKSGLAHLNLKPIDSAVLDHMKRVFETETLPKIKADTKRNARNVAIARSRVVLS